MIWGSDGVWEAKVFVAAVAFCVVLPLSLVEQMNSLRFVGFLCFGANLFTYLVVGLRFFFGAYIQGWSDQLTNIRHMTTSEIWFNTDSPAEVLKAIPIFTQIINVHWVLLPLFAELRAPSRRRMNQVTAKSIAISSSLYLVSGLLGYLSWLSETKSNILLNYSKNDGLVIAAKGLVTLACAFNCPCLVVVLRQMLLEVIQQISTRCKAEDKREAQSFEDEPPREKSSLFRFLLTSFLIALATITAIIVPGLDVAFGLTGSLTASVIIYIVPGLMFLSLDQKNAALRITNCSRTLAMLVVGWGVSMGVVCSTYIVYNVAT